MLVFARDGVTAPLYRHALLALMVLRTEGAEQNSQLGGSVCWCLDHCALFAPLVSWYLVLSTANAGSGSAGWHPQPTRQHQSSNTHGLQGAVLAGPGRGRPRDCLLSGVVPRVTARMPAFCEGACHARLVRSRQGVVLALQVPVRPPAPCSAAA